jgi:hypothetical protein
MTLTNGKMTFSKVARMALEQSPNAVYDMAAQTRIVARDLKAKFDSPTDALAYVQSPAKAGRSKAAKARKSLTADQLFFYEHAGFGYDPKTETREQGRIRCAVELADAEATGRRLGYGFEWEYDSDPDLSWMSAEERQLEHEVLCCRIPDPENTRYSLASLCGITDPDRAYRRVVEAELAQEAIGALDREIETLDAH